MTPYYDDGTCVIYHGDCREVLPMLNGVGLVITSPPYNLGRDLEDQPYEATHNRKSASRSSRSHRMTEGYVEHDDALPLDEYRAFQREVLGLSWRSLRADGAIYYNHKPRCLMSRVLLPLDYVPDECALRQIVIWDRVTMPMASSPRAYTNRHEWLLVLAREDFRLKSRSVSATYGDLWRFPPVTEDLGHPCPFPLTLPARILETANVRGPVVDPFVGIGTTLRAAKDAGVPGVGIEISERYCEIAAKRLAQEVLAFDSPVSSGSAEVAT